MLKNIINTCLLASPLRPLYEVKGSFKSLQLKGARVKAAKKLTNLALYSALTFAGAACGNKTASENNSTVPPNLLPEDVFVKVLTDFALAESAVNLNVKNVAVNRMDTVYAFDPLKENHVRQGKYDSTVQFYTKHPELYKNVYEDVLAALSEIQTRGDSLRKDSTSK